VAVRSVDGRRTGSALALRESLTPQMRHYEALGGQRLHLPFVMGFHEPDFVSPVVTTDGQGFRTTIRSDGRARVELESFLKVDSASTGVILGASTAFGVGATGDQHSISSVLNRTSHTTWANFGGRAFNSTQEAFLFALYLPQELDHLVVLSGVNNLTLAYLRADTSPVFNSFFSQEAGAIGVGPSGVRTAFTDLLGALGRAAQRRLAPKNPIRDLSLQYRHIMACFERDLRVLRDLGRGGGFEVSFVLQPVATWIDKALSDEEADLFEALDSLDHQWKHIAAYLLGHKDSYCQNVQEICSSLSIPFMDLNKEEAFAAETWLFVDRVHLTDEGYRLAAALLKERLGL